jgi:hypothetical protein
MRTRLSACFPFSLRASLTALSAVGVILVGGGLSAAPALAATEKPASAETWNDVLAQQRITAYDETEHREHLAHLAHTAHVAAEQERAAAARAYAAYEKQQARLRQQQEAAAARQREETPEPAVHAAAKTYSAPAQVASVQKTSYTGSSSVQECIIRAESGGNPNIFNASGHYGLYQFSESTWEEYGGSAASFGHASVAEQNAVFAVAVATNGYRDWTPYDGC